MPEWLNLSIKDEKICLFGIPRIDDEKDIKIQIFNKHGLILREFFI